MKRLAIASGVNNPVSITTNKLRKQIAIVLQVLNMNKEESEQFAKFMGHNKFYKRS